ncbi:unnamed protein product [Rotaria sp. Silwood1]|nr:unnamed protein product [Rotaria sp. Silwood1]
MELDNRTKSYFNTLEKNFGDISLIIKPIINDKECQSILSRSMIRKIFNLLNSQYIDRAGRLKAPHVIKTGG